MVGYRIHLSEKPWKIADFNCVLYKRFLFFGNPTGGHLDSAFNIQIENMYIRSRKSILFGRKKCRFNKDNQDIQESIIDPLHSPI